MYVCVCTCVRLAQDLRCRKVYATNRLSRLMVYLTKHNVKSILRPKTTSEGQKWMKWKREHPYLVPMPLEIMFANTISSKYLYFELGRYAPILVARRKYMFISASDRQSRTIVSGEKCSEFVIYIRFPHKK